MLTELRITDFAIIDQLELKPAAGLLVFTGETGAGKSIIMDALDMLLGGKADATSIRLEAPPNANRIAHASPHGIRPTRYLTPELIAWGPAAT